MWTLAFFAIGILTFQIFSYAVYADNGCYDKFVFAWQTVNPVLECLNGSTLYPVVLSELNDVVIVNVQDDEVLTYNGTHWINAESGALVGVLNDLTDVVIIAPTNGNYLKYNGSYWNNVNPLIDDNEDVDLSGLATANILLYNGSHWKNQVVSGDISISANGLVTIANNAITNAKMADNAIGSAEIINDSVGDNDIATQTSTKITISNKAQLNSAIAYEDEANIFAPTQKFVSDDSQVRLDEDDGAGFPQIQYSSANTVKSKIFYDIGAQKLILAVDSDVSEDNAIIIEDDADVIFASDVDINDGKLKTTDYQVYQNSDRIVLERQSGNNAGYIFLKPKGTSEIGELRLLSDDSISAYSALQVGAGSSNNYIGSIHVSDALKPLILEMGGNDIITLNTDNTISLNNRRVVNAWLDQPQIKGSGNGQGLEIRDNAGGTVIGSIVRQDNDIKITSINVPFIQFGSKAGDPSGADIASGYCATWKNTSTGIKKYWCNDGGTYVGVALS